MKARLVTTEYEVFLPGLPAAFDGFKIAHLADSHSRPVSGVYEAVKKISPDITVVTGDMLHDDDYPRAELEELLARLSGLSPVYMVSGNHDVRADGYREFFAQLEHLGVHFLDGKSVLIEKNDEKIQLSGAPDPYSKRRREIAAAVQKSMAELAAAERECAAGLSPKPVRILLFHRANLFDKISGLGYELVLSGHMHGGQIRLPKLGGLLAPASSLPSGQRMILPKYCYGRFERGHTTMIVNSGMSASEPNLPRWGNPCEAGAVVLRRG